MTEFLLKISKIQGFRSRERGGLNTYWVVVDFREAGCPGASKRDQVRDIPCTRQAGFASRVGDPPFYGDDNLYGGGIEKQILSFFPVNLTFSFFEFKFHNGIDYTINVHLSRICKVYHNTLITQIISYHGKMNLDKDRIISNQTLWQVIGKIQ